MITYKKSSQNESFSIFYETVDYKEATCLVNFDFKLEALLS